MSASVRLLQDPLSLSRLLESLQVSFESNIIMSEIQTAMALLISNFEKYAGREGDKHTLNKAELKELLQNELGEMLGKATDKAAVDRIFNELDSNKDNSVDFEEFGKMICCLTVMCHEYFIGKK
ncbi:ictacalcin [Labrus bergylta]|uniref:Protein S100 n=1 Tax=Labrus bergylta TaxID=56723 RepID=A0A3Q3GQ41_9LABR|nr:ictacalcin-like [Labrus bergylta]